MKLEIDKDIVDDSDLEGDFFEIDDESFVFDLLRNKMYSNPILAVCREISCNARDAHREAGVPDLPIHIHLPNSTEPFLKIKDFGPGISPERMNQVYRKYGSSTKRNDALQQGSFGIGAKSPFSISDNFTIITNVSGTQRNYSCFIDSSKKGKLILLSESPTTESNGTEIIIPVKSSNFIEFIKCTEQATRHWKIKPIIKGGTFNYLSNKKLLEGSNWVICDSNFEYDSKKMYLIVDDIEYPIHDQICAETLDKLKKNLFLNFEVGEISLAANREQIYLDKSTREKIKLRLDLFAKETCSILNEKINELSSLREALNYYNSSVCHIFHKPFNLGSLKWKNVSLPEYSTVTLCPIFTFTKKYSYNNSASLRLKRVVDRSFYVSNNTFLAINDLDIKDITTNQAAKIFEKFPGTDQVQVICPNERVTAKMLQESHHLDELGITPLSNFVRASKKRKYTPTSSRLTMYKFNMDSCSFERISYGSIEIDKNKKVLCLFSKRYQNDKQIFLKNGKPVYNVDIKSILKKFVDYSFYAIDNSIPETRIKEDLDDFENIEDFIEENISSEDISEYVKIKALYNMYGHLNHTLMEKGQKLKELIEDPNSFILKEIETHSEIDRVVTEGSDILKIYQSLNSPISDDNTDEFLKNNPRFNAIESKKKFITKYPLLNNHYSFSVDIKHLAQYINFCDSL